MNLVIGKNGFIAKQLALRSEYIYTTSIKSDESSLYFDLNYPELFNYSILNKGTTILMLAAISSPDECRNNFEKAYRINVAGTKTFIKKALERQARVLFFSSDVVYGNTETEVDENSATDPIGPYATMKNEIEKIFENEPNFKVFRLSYVLSSQDKYLSYLKSCQEKSQVAEVFHPFYRKVIYIEDVIKAIEYIIHNWDMFKNQKFNICGVDQISRKDIADYFNAAIKNDPLNYITVKPNDSFWESRPKYIDVTSIYLKVLLGRAPTPISDAVNEIIKNIEK